MLKLTPDEGELLRTNFKLELENKHAELLMMLRPLQLAELNVLLSDLYHLSFYTI